jgi:hypothetical protein
MTMQKVKDYLLWIYENHKNKVLLGAGAAGVYYAGTQHLLGTVLKALLKMNS